MLAIIDIDGTLADNTHRSHLVDGEQKDWDAFLQPALVRIDAVIPGTQRALKIMQSKNFEIVFLTGRNEGLRGATSEWLEEHFGIKITEKNLIMRPFGNMDKPTDFKRRELSKFVYRGHENWITFDDDTYMQPVYMEFNAIVLHAPDCWKTLFLDPQELPPETHWRK